MEGTNFFPSLFNFSNLMDFSRSTSSPPSPSSVSVAAAAATQSPLHHMKGIINSTFSSFPSSAAPFSPLDPMASLGGGRGGDGAVGPSVMSLAAPAVSSTAHGLHAILTSANGTDAVASNGDHDGPGHDDLFESFQWSSDMLMRHSPEVSSMYCLAYAFIFIIGIVGNSCVVAVVLRNPRMRTVTNYFIVNLALADILVLLFCLPATLLSNLFIPWLLGLWMCKAVSYLQGVAVSASINTLVAVSADRFLAICYPLKCQMTRTVARRIILLTWVFSALIALPWTFYFQLKPLDEDKFPDVLLCSEEWPDRASEVTHFVVANLCLLYLGPLVVITACYLAIWLKVWRRHIPGCEETSKDGKSLNVQMDLLMQRSKLKVAKMMVVVVVIFVISWLPLYIIFTRVKLGPPFEQDSVAERLLMTCLPMAQWLGASNSCINPILYAFFNKKYRKGFAQIIKSKKCCGTIRYEGGPTTASHYYHRNGTIASRSTRRTRTTRVDTQDNFFPALNGMNVGKKVDRLPPLVEHTVVHAAPSSQSNSSSGFAGCTVTSNPLNSPSPSPGFYVPPTPTSDAGGITCDPL